IVRRPVDAMRMQLCQPRVVAVAVEGVPRIPLDQDQHLARLDRARGGLAKLAERDHASAVRLDFPRRALRIREVLVPVRDVEEVEGVDFHCQISRAASTHNLSFARSSASVSGLPPMVLAKPHCGLMANRLMSMKRAASSVLRFNRSLLSNVAVLELTSPRTTPFSFGTWRSGEKPPARGVSNSSRKWSTLVRPKNFSATES